MPARFQGEAPRIWFRVEPDAKLVKNRLHLDIHASSGGAPYASRVRHIPIEVRKQRVDAEARRLTDLGATCTGALTADGLGSLRGRDEGPRRQRVRHQLSPPSLILTSPHQGS